MLNYYAILNFQEKKPPAQNHKKKLFLKKKNFIKNSLVSPNFARICHSGEKDQKNLVLRQ
jgi:hypothetical protein